MKGMVPFRGRMLPQGACPARMHPPFSFRSCPKRKRAVHGPKEKGAWRAPVQWPSARDGGRRISACSDFAWPSGTLGSSAIFVVTVPWRMVPTSSGCKDAFEQFLFYCLALRRSQYFHHQCSPGSSFRAFRCATRSPGGRGGFCNGPMRASAPTTARAARSDCAAVGGFAAYGCGVPLAGKRNARKEEPVEHW